MKLAIMAVMQGERWALSFFVQPAFRNSHGGMTLNNSWHVSASCLAIWIEP